MPPEENGMRLARGLICCLLALATFVPRWAQAEHIDSAANRELLEQGYTLKQDGKYAETRMPVPVWVSTF
ncbi:MAG TPA: hypothetical protein VHW01_22245 [Polyangiaceae bacterium]|jgi:hypothetical protein|nr:hypothetical protein [Polyangiaceae bacterium]